MSKYTEVTIAVPIKLFVKKASIQSEFGLLYGYSSTFGIGSISKIETFGTTPQDAVWKMAQRLQGVLSG